MDAFKKISVLLAFFLSLFMREGNAQYPKWDDPNSLPIWMTPDEETRKHEIGKNFLKSAAITGPVRNIAEFERMEGVLVRYPLGLPTSLIAAFSKHTVVYTLVSSTTNENNCKSAYQSAGANMTNCKFIRAATDSYWTRDYGPWFITDQNNKVSIVDFPYNRPRANDDAVNGVVANYFSVPMYSMPVVHTGGNYMTDGWGISASTNLVISENSSESFVRTNMQSYLGVDTYHITIDPLGDYIKHIDCWGKFLDVDKVLIAQVPTSNSNYSKYEQVANYFATQTSAYGTPYQVFRVYEPNGEPYTNSLILNDRVYVPTKGNSNDAVALNVYRTAMPGYTVTGITYSSWASTDALHCRAMGLADRGMLYIKHLPITGTKPYQPSFDITAEITPYSLQSLVTDSLIVFYKTNVRTSFMAVTMANTAGSTYSASLPVNAGETSVSYYIFAKDNSGRREKHPFIGAPDPHTFTVAAPSITANFTASTTTANVGQNITFTDASTGGTITSWAWDFGSGAVPATATTQGPHVVQYSTTGSKTVSLTINGSYTTTKTNYITVVVPVTGVSVTPATVALSPGQTQQLTATVAPANATNQSVTWSSSNASVASVNSSGLITAVGGGSAVVTVTTVDGGFTATSAVTVTVPVTGVSVSPASVTLAQGGIQQLTATIAPTNATDKTVTWSSDDPGVAIVDDNGLVTAVELGSCSITATTNDGTYTASCMVTVGNPVTGVAISQPTGVVYLGETLQLIATIQPDDASNMSVVWSSSNPSAATVRYDGLVTGVGNGTALITVTTVEGGFTASCNITAIVPVTGVNVSPETASLSPGMTLQLTPTISPSNATDKTVSWSTSNHAVATVNSSGLVTTSGSGTALITVTTNDGSYTASCAVEVTACTNQTINSQGFVSGWGIWTDGGTDCGRTYSYPNADAYSIYLRDNTSTSYMTTSNLDLVGYEIITVAFSYFPVSFDNSGEDFWLQISTDGGTTYTTIEEWNRGDEFVNSVRYNDVVTLQGPFTSATRVRFRCDASSDDDVVYIDNVVISGCYNAALASGALKSSAIQPVENNSATINNSLDQILTVYPNPSNGKINLLFSDYYGKQAVISVIAPSGQVVFKDKSVINRNYPLDLKGMVSGFCILRIETESETVIRKILLMHN